MKFRKVGQSDAVGMIDRGVITFDGYPPIVDGVWRDDRCVVIVQFEKDPGLGRIGHLMICPLKGGDVLGHRYLMEVKADLFGRGSEAFEVFKGEEEDEGGEEEGEVEPRVRHLWILPEGASVKFGEAAQGGGRGRRKKRSEVLN